MIYYSRENEDKDWMTLTRRVFFLFPSFRYHFTVGAPAGPFGVKTTNDEQRRRWVRSGCKTCGLAQNLRGVYFAGTTNGAIGRKVCKSQIFIRALFMRKTATIRQNATARSNKPLFKLNFDIPLATMRELQDIETFLENARNIERIILFSFVCKKRAANRTRLPRLSK